MADVDDVVLGDEFLGWWAEDVDEAEGDLERTNQHLNTAVSLLMTEYSHYWVATPVAGTDRS